MGKYAEGFLPAACDALSGNYLAGETKRHCVMYDYNFDGEKGFWDFKITKQGGSSWLNREDCMLRLGNEALGCGNGGVSTVADWVIS